MTAARVAIVFRGDVSRPAPIAGQTRYAAIFDEFTRQGGRAEPVVYADSVADEVMARLKEFDAALVWVDPIVGGEDRVTLDAVLREVADAGVFVSAHPDVIQAMGTKKVLFDTRHHPWGTRAHWCPTLEDLGALLPRLLEPGTPWVVKQDRGSSGNGVWRLDVRDSLPAIVLQPATRGAVRKETSINGFLSELRRYLGFFGGQGGFVVQPFAQRLSEGMIRSYMTHDTVVGFGHQLVTALTDPPTGADGPPDPLPRTYHGPEVPQFQPLRRLLQRGWLNEMMTMLELTPHRLPVIWDADFLLGPRTPSGGDTYQLCEINVSGVFPIPSEAVEPLVAATLDRVG